MRVADVGPETARLLVGASASLTGMTKRLLQTVRPARLLLLATLAALVTLVLPSESFALVRQNPASSSFFSSEWETCRNDPVNNSDPLGLEGGNPISFLPLDGAALDFQSYGNWYTEEGYHQQTVSAAALAFDLNANIMRSALPDPKGSAQLVKDQFGIASNSKEGAGYRAAAGAAVVLGAALGTLDVVTLVPGKAYVRRLLVEGVEKVPEYLLRKKISTLGEERATRLASKNTSRQTFYVTSDGTAIPATGYRAIGGAGVDEAASGIIAPRSYPGTYVTFENISGMSQSEVKSVLQLPRTPSHVASFDTLQLVDDIRIPTEYHGEGLFPEPLTISYPGLGVGQASQAVTMRPIKLNPNDVRPLRP